jgi:phosphoribosylaminoimidazole-succinocarboxamide synthase
VPEAAPIAPIQLGKYPLIRSGKVRDIYDAGDRLLLVASDRLSAFDVILPTPIPDKGKILTAISDFWFAFTRGICPNHLISTDVESLDLSPSESEALHGRTMIGRKADRIDIECVVRGCLAGSGYKEYATAGTLAGESLPAGLERGDRLPEPRFTPAIKNDEGHDENISREKLRSLIGDELAAQLEAMSIDLFDSAAARAAQAGLILADSKFEFGWIDGQLTLIDEALTPDSSRYWDAATMRPGSEPPSFDKQIVRDWLEAQPWDKTAPGPTIPEEIIALARDRYQQVYDRLVTSHTQEQKDAS